jgi:predicted nucleotidyltransferase
MARHMTGKGPKSFVSAESGDPVIVIRFQIHPVSILLIYVLKSIKGVDRVNIDGVLTTVTSAFSNVSGIDALVLGGSRATNTANPHSDIDIGVYYNSELDLAAFKKSAATIDDAHRNDCITNIGEWGPWINGGGWLTVQGIHVDILFRDTSRVSECIEDCMNGIITLDYQCGHLFAFVNSIYMGEVYHCKLLHSSNGRIETLKELLRKYPQTYKNASIKKFLWECEFSLMCGKKAIARQDIIYGSGSLFRCAVCLIYAAFSWNEMYCLNEKGSLHRLQREGAELPEHFEALIENALSMHKKDTLDVAFDEMTSVYQSSVALFTKPAKAPLPETL